MEKILKNIYEEMIKDRRYLHSIPETGFNEIKTSEFIKGKLQELGFEVETVAKTGVIGYKKGSSQEGAIAFRADMDGLSVKEETGLPFSSEHQGKMHACGHDGHMAIALGLARLISKVEKLNQDVVLIFQPAEEGPGGAELIIKEGIFEKYNIQKIFGLHILTDVEEGKVGVKPGPIMAQTGEFDITLKAKGGHGAMPHTAIDGIYIASQLINSFQSIVSRNIEPVEGAVLTVGKIHGGEARNVIAEKVRVEGTIRAFSQEVYDQIKSRIVEISKGLEKMYGITIDIEFIDMYPAVINDMGLFEVLKDVLEEDELVLIKPMMPSEDFSYYQQVVPGIFFMLGARNEELGHCQPLHNCKFSFNEEILLNGLEIYNKVCKKLNVF